MKATPRDGAERLLAIATVGLPSDRSVWGVAMRAELAAIDDPDARRRFARSAARAAIARGLGIHIGLILGAAFVVATITVTASRLQLPEARPGVLSVTVTIPALVLLITALISARLTASRPSGLLTGLLAAVTSFVALSSVLTVEGTVWMDRHGVFILDADPPRGTVDTTEIMLDVFTTGMWVGHTLFWLPAVLIGALIGPETRRTARQRRSTALTNS